MERANRQSGKITSETINVAMETFQNEDFGGLVPNITYSKTDHGGSFKGRIVRIHENMTYSPLTNFFAPGKDKVQILREKK
jgi:branched-chain amino acid transport system substrate-binding protein